MPQPVVVPPTPGAWAWVQLRWGLFPWPPVWAVGWLALGLPAMLAGRPVALAYAGLAAAVPLYPLVSWHDLRRSAPLPLKAPPPADRPWRTGAWYAVWHAAATPLWVLAMLDMSGGDYARWLVPVAVCTGIAALSSLAQRWAARRRRPRDLSALTRLRQDLEAQWAPVTLHATSRTGHATLTFQTSEGPELVWYLHCEDDSRVLPEMVLLMDRQLDAYDLTRGWIVTRATWFPRLTAFAEGFDILFATPDHFARRQRQDDAAAATTVAPGPPRAHAPLGERFTHGRST